MRHNIGYRRGEFVNRSRSARHGQPENSAAGPRLAVAMTGGVAVCGFLALSAGFATGELVLVSVLASLQTVITICLAGIFHRERLIPRQWAGLVVTLAGLAAIHLT